MSRVNGGAKPLNVNVSDLERRTIDWVLKSAKVSEQLEGQFGLGESPALREQLYENIRRSIAKHGAPAFKVVKDLVHVAATKDLPALWFSKAVRNELIRKQLWVSR